VAILNNKSDNIFISIRANATKDSTEYSDEEGSLDAAAALMLATCGLEFFNLLVGLTIFNDKLNIVEIFCHFFACILCAWFIIDLWDVQSLWIIFGVFVAPFLFLEVLITVQPLVSRLLAMRKTN